ncbi:MAG: hypothetical protein FWD75_10450, partial [Propionibacteriaceae bacterium]|nr:hypothetical protein [Propionibacteriaceae bacterium]
MSHIPSYRGDATPSSSVKRVARASSLGVSIGFRLVVGLVVTALLATLIAIGVESDRANASPYGDDGLVVTVTPERIKPNSSDSFTLQVKDLNLSGATFDYYTLWGVPRDWVVRVGSWALSPISPEPLLYRIAVRDAIGGQIQITPPPGFVGTLSGVTLGRLMDSPNQITDFDHGTFDYLGEAKPRLPYGATQYGYHDPTVAYTTPACNSAQYGPCDGDYTIWPTANFNGRASHYNNYWADLRSTTNPMEWPKTEEICRDWWNSTPGGMALNQTMVTEAESRYSGKIAVFNGAVDMPVPNDFLATTVTGLEAHRAYAFGAHVANISDDPSGGTKAVRTAAYVKTSLADVGTIIGSTRDLPKQPSCFNDMTEWSQISSVVMTGDATQLILSLRNYGAGGFGNDVAIDGLTLFPMAQASVDLKVVSANPALTVSKVASPESTVRPGDLVMYTVTATNSGDVRLDPVRVVDDLSGVLDNATFVVGSEKAVIGGVPRGAVSLVGTTLTWTGVLDVAETVTLTYSARVNMDLGPKDRLVNHVIGTGTYPEEPGMDVPSTCRTGEEPMCSVTLDPRVPGLYVVKVSDPVSGSLVRPGAPVTYTVTATNVGTVDLDPVAVTDDLTGVLAHARVVKGSVAASIGGQAVTAPTITGTTLTWSGILPVGKTVTLTYRVEVNADVAPGDRLVNVVVGTGTDPGEPNTEVPSTCVTGEEPGCSSELIPAVPKLVVEKTADPASGATVRPGDVVTYHVAATNVGTVPLDPTWITDDLSGVLAHAQMVDGSLSASVGGVMVSPPKVSGTTLTWSGALGAGETVMVSYQVRVNADVKPGDDLVNHVVAKGTDPGDPNTEVPGTCVTGEDPECTTDHPVGVPKLVVAKVADPVSGSVVRPGDTVSYTVTATNVGTVGFDPVVVTDDLAGVLAHARIQDGSLSAHVAGAPVHPPTVDGTTLTWSGALPTGASVVLGYQVVVNADVSPGDELVNHVVAKGTDPGDPNTEVPGTCVTGEDPACTTTHPAGVPKLVIEKVSDPVSGSHVRPGGTVTYAVTATNAGTVDFDPVRVTDDLSGVLAHAQMVEGSLSAQVGGKVVAAPMVSGTTLTWSGPLRVGEAVTLSYQVVVNADVAPGDALVNHVVGKGTDPEIPGTEVPGECVTGVGPECTTAHPAGVPKMVVEKVSDPASGSLVRPGDTLAYTVIATNVGTVDFDPVTVTDDLSGVLAHARMVDGSMSAQVGGVIVGPPQVKGTTLTWSGALAAGSSVTLAYAVQVNADVSPGDLLVNHVLGTGVDPGDPGDPGTEVPGTCVTGVDPECTTTHPAGVPKLVMEKVSDPVSGSRVRPGDTVTYTVTATNTGSVDFAPVIVADDLSGVLAHARMVDGSVSAHVGGVGVDDPLLIGTTLIWSGPLPVGRSVTMSYQVVVNEDVAPGDVLVNHVVSKGTDPEVPGTEVPGTCVTGQAAECTTDHPVGVPKLVVEKTADPVSGSLVRPGDTVKYAVTATNVGTVELDPVTVTDDLSGVLAHAQIVDGSLSASADGVSVHAPSVSGTTLTWKGVLSVGQSVTVSYRVVVNADVTPGDRLVNHVVGKGTDPDEPETEVPGTCVTGKDPECTTDHPVGVPQLVLEKTADPVSGSQVHAGDTVTYTVTATNVGTTD